MALRRPWPELFGVAKGPNWSETWFVSLEARFVSVAGVDEGPPLRPGVRAGKNCLSQEAVKAKPQRLSMGSCACASITMARARSIA